MTPFKSQTSAREVNVPTFHHRNLNMALPLSYARGLSLCLLLLLSQGFISLPVLAQEGGSINPGALNYQKAPVATILDLYEQL